MRFPIEGVPRPEEGDPLPDPNLPRVKVGVPLGLAAGEMEILPDSEECVLDPGRVRSIGEPLLASYGEKDCDLLPCLLRELLGELPENDGFLATGFLALD